MLNGHCIFFRKIDILPILKIEFFLIELAKIIFKSCNVGYYQTLLLYYWDDHTVFYFDLFMKQMTLIDFLVSLSCIPGINSTWFWCIIFLIFWCIWFGLIFYRLFVSMFINETSVSFCFLIMAVMFDISIIPISRNIPLPLST